MPIASRRTKHGRTLLLLSLAVLILFAVTILVMIRRQRPTAPNPPLHEQSSLFPLLHTLP